MAKDQHVVEAVLRDKDLEWFQAPGTEHSGTARTNRRVRSGGTDVARTTLRVRTAGAGAGGQDVNTVVYRRIRRCNGALAPPPGKATKVAD